MQQTKSTFWTHGLGIGEWEAAILDLVMQLKMLEVVIVRGGVLDEGQWQRPVVEESQVHRLMGRWLVTWSRNLRALGLRG